MFKCERCGDCCKPLWGVPAGYTWSNSWVVFNQYDIERAASFLLISTAEFTAKYKLDGGALYLNGAPCPLLSKDNLCIIQNAKPTICAEWPKLKNIDRNTAEKYIARCPGCKEIEWQNQDEESKSQTVG